MPGSATHRPPQVLVVEDNAALRLLFTLVLTHAGATVHPASSVPAAVAALAQQAVDLVITDAFAGQPSAVFTSTARLRQAAGAVPVLLATAHRVDPAAAVAAGFSGVLQKPFALEALEQQLATLL